MIVRTFAGLEALTTQTPSWLGTSPAGAVNLYGYHETYARIYATQPNVRICVDFLARNIAHIGIQVFRRVSDTDRARLTDHDLARWLTNPTPTTSKYRLIENLISDLGIYYNAYWLKVRYVGRDNRPAIGLMRLPPSEMTVTGGLLPAAFHWTVNGRPRDFAPSEIVYFNGYNPLNPLMGLSPLETARQILTEEAAAGANREAFWRNAGRMEGIIERPIAAPKWSPQQKNDWRAQWQEFSGSGAKVGQTAVLEDGMTAKPWSFSAKDSEYTEGGKLRREIVAALYGIPQPFVGILDHATFSNIIEQHKNLYQDTLGPWTEMVTQEIEGQLLPEARDARDVYMEFNIDAKLAGTPEDRAASLSLSIGRPWRTVNEGRALENLPRDPDPASDRIAPQQGGPSDASAQPSARPAFRRTGAPPDDVPDPDATHPGARVLLTDPSPAIEAHP